MADPYTLFSQGNIIQAFTTFMNSYLGGWMWAAIFLAIITVVYIKTESLGITSLIGLVAFFFMNMIVPMTFFRTGFLLVVFILSLVLFRIFIRRQQ